MAVIMINFNEMINKFKKGFEGRFLPRIVLCGLWQERFKFGRMYTICTLFFHT